jgi:hypothetical protein
MAFAMGSFDKISSVKGILGKISLQRVRLNLLSIIAFVLSSRQMAARRREPL